MYVILVGTAVEMMSDLRARIRDGWFEFSEHATDPSVIPQISEDDIREAFANGEIIETYPDDKYGPSCLVLGFTHQNRPLHIQCSYPSRPLIKIITLYEPDPRLWVDNRTRRRSNGNE